MEATEDPALQSGKPIAYAPPTFSTTFRIAVPGLELDETKMQLLHGEQIYDYTRPLRIDEEVTCIARITDVRERLGAAEPSGVFREHASFAYDLGYRRPGSASLAV